MLEPLGEVGANFSLQLSSRTQFTRINNKKVIAENQCEKHKKSSFFFLFFFNVFLKFKFSRKCQKKSVYVFEESVGVDDLLNIVNPYFEQMVSKL